MRSRALAAAWFALAALALPLRAGAQIPYLDDVPWAAFADTTGEADVVFSMDRFWGKTTGWVADRAGVTFTGRLGERSRYFVRAHALRFDTAGMSALERWPDLRGSAAADWPGLASPSGPCRPEVGLMARTALLGQPIEVGFAGGLPFGSDSLYPFSSASIPLRLELRRVWRLTGAWQLAAIGGREHVFDSSRELLSRDAFPSLWRLGARLAWHAGAWREIAISYDERLAADASSRRLGCEVWLPLNDHHAFGVSWRRELGSTVDRAATNLVSVAWRFAGLSPPAPPPLR